MNAIMATEDQGIFQIHPNATIEDWDEIKGQFEIEEKCNLMGWAEYTKAYTVRDEDGNEWIYFVAETDA